MNILLGITGGIAAYKTPELVRLFIKRHDQVQCVLTEQGAALVSANALAAVSGHPVHTSSWSNQPHMDHIALARWCDACVIAPATANCIAKLALGLADDVLSTLVLALEPQKRLIIAPAMNTVMWEKSIVQQHLTTLRTSGARILEPIAGLLACGEQGVGAMAELTAIIGAVDG